MADKLNVFNNINIDIGKTYYINYTHKGSIYEYFPVCFRCNYYFICVKHAVSIPYVTFQYDCFMYQVNNKDEILLKAREYSSEFRLLIGEYLNEEDSPGDTS